VESIGKRIQSLRVAKSLTQTELGNAVGVSKTAVSNWEQGYANGMRIDAFYRLLALFDMTDNGEWLIYGDKGPPRIAIPVKRRKHQNNGGSLHGR
jgi:transcriptional regulator with XRE-family HTH domain